MYMTFFGFFVFGAIVGSFLNVVVARAPRKEQVTRGRSYCPHCRKWLHWWELVPLVSFVVLRGRCSACKAPIAWRDFFGEGLSAIVWAITGSAFVALGETLMLIVVLPLVTLLTLLFLFDGAHHLLPNRFLLPAFILAAGFSAWRSLEGALIGSHSLFFPVFSVSSGGANVAGALENYTLTMLGATAFLGALYVLTRGRGMGLGDVKLAAVLGLVAGWPGILDVFFVAFSFGALVGIIQIARKKMSLRSSMAFGPYLIGSLFIFFWWHIYGGL